MIITYKTEWKSYQYGILAPSKGERATFPFDLTQVRSSGGVQNPGRFLVGQFNQAYTMGKIPCWFTSFPPTKKKKKQGYQEKVNKGRKSTNHYQRVVKKSSQIGQKPETEQSERKVVEKKYNTPSRKYAAKREKIIWRKKRTDNIKSKK